MSINIYPSLGILLGIEKRIRKIRGELTQAEFAKLFGVNQNTISRWEKGGITDLQALERIANYGGVTVQWLLRGDRPSAPQPPGHPAEVYDARPGPPLDVALLAEILTEIMKYIADQGLELPPQREARLVALLYDHCQENQVKPDRTLVERFLWITRVD